MSEVKLRLINGFFLLRMSLEIRPKGQGALYNRVRLINGRLRYLNRMGGGMVWWLNVRLVSRR